MLDINVLRQTVIELKPYLDAFEEFDKTGRWNKVFPKRKVIFTVDEDIFRRFKANCKLDNVPMSNKIESFMEINL